MTAVTRTRIKRKDGSSIVFDAAADIAPVHADNVTSLPIESGARIADHVETLPDSVSLTVYQSESPTTEDPTANRGSSLYAELLALKKAREVITLITAARAYDNMLVTNISPDYAAGLGSNLICKLHLQEIVTVETRIVALKRPAPKANKNKTKKAEGTKPTQTVPEQTKKSAIAKLRDWVHGD